jgi:hypothetical protein
MSPEALSRYLQKLPNFITFFFSSMLVRTLGEVGTILKFTTEPEFQNVGWDVWLTVFSFCTTLYFVVFSWLAYNLLIERFPYSANLSLFFLDVGRFVVLYAILNFSFLANHPPRYVYFIVSLGVFHVGAMGWHLLRIRLAHSTERPEHNKDIQFLGAMAVVYFVVAAIYAAVVVAPWSNSHPWGIHCAFVFVTSAFMVFICTNRLHAMRVRMSPAAPVSA